MRPIDLTPAEERRGLTGVPARSGPLAYVIVGALGLLLIGVVMLVLASNKVSDRESEVTNLEASKAAATARAEAFAPYASFQQVTQQRTQTIASLADSRFDWPRAIRQLARVLPPRVYFKQITGSAGGGFGEEETGGAAGIAGPSLTLVGCAPGQGTVAGFVASLKQIDGVTRVALKKSTVPKESAESNEEHEDGPCDQAPIPQFEIIVAFDAAPPSPDGAIAVEPEAAPPVEGEEGSTEAGPTTEGESAEPETGETAPNVSASAATASGAEG